MVCTKIGCPSGHPIFIYIFLLDTSVTTINGNILTIHIGAARRCEEERASIQLALTAVALQRNVTLGDSLEVVAVECRGCKVGVEVTRAD